MILSSFSLLTSLLVFLVHDGVASPLSNSTSLPSVNTTAMSVVTSTALPAANTTNSGGPFQLTVTPAQINRHTTKNVMLRCDRNLKVSSVLKQIFRMRIVHKTASGWSLVAEQRISEGNTRVEGNVTASASIAGDISKVFLQVSWGNIGNDSFGDYRCEVMGVDASFTVVTENSTETSILEAELPVEYFIGVAMETQETLSADEKKLEMLEEFQHSLTQWPGGFYALIQPKTGCPVDLAFFGGTHKFITIERQNHTPSSSNGHSSALSPRTNFISSLKNVVTMEFCEVTTQFNTATWPKGSFCVHKLIHQDCPVGFTYGWVHLDTKNTIRDGRNNVADNVSGLYLYFCCQNTTAASVPAQLPTSSPFLLYRHGGICQAVQGMNVTEEYLHIDTVDDGKSDPTSLIHPDHDQPGTATKFHLCYYNKL